MKVVLDTNVFVSGIHWYGDCERILREWFLGKFELISSIPIIEELIRILLSFKVPLNSEDIVWWENLILERCNLVLPKKKFKVVEKDPDDDKFIEAAIEGKADYIITKDNGLLKVKVFEGIKIISPEDFLKLLKLS